MEPLDNEEMDAPQAGGDEPSGSSYQASYLKRLTELTDRISQAGESSYGANAHERWKGTPVMGLSLFKPNRPSFNAMGRRLIDGSTHMATPPQGLIGGKSLEQNTSSPLTSEDKWVSMFGRKSPDGIRSGGGTGGGMSNLAWSQIFGPAQSSSATQTAKGVDYDNAKHQTYAYA